MTPSIPVICDRCRLAGTAGASDFSHLGDLLDFAPVPRKNKRVDGWTADKQRAFIAALSATGSRSQAARAIGMTPSGLDRLRSDEGSESFRAAWDRALAIAAQAGTIRLASGLADVVARSAQIAPPSRLRGHEPEPEGEEDDDSELRTELIEKLIAKFQRKVGQERNCRLAGRIVEADFYLRQITALEVAFDLMIDGHGDQGWTMLMEARRGTRNLLEIADTYMARVLDQARRDQWAAMAEPGRPEVWPERYLLGDPAKVDARTEPLENLGPITRPAAGVEQGQWMMMDTEEQRRIYAEQHRRDAEAQIKWEAEGASQASEWRDRNSAPGLPGEGDRPQGGGGGEVLKPKPKRKTK